LLVLVKAARWRAGKDYLRERQGDKYDAIIFIQNLKVGNGG